MQEGRRLKRKSRCPRQEGKEGIVQEGRRVKSRLIHPQHLGGIWIGQNQYRLPLAPLNEYPESWCWKVADW